MASSTTWLLAGIGIGVGVGLGAALLVRQQRALATDGQTQAHTAEPELTVHDVVRDDAGRIQSVETFSGVGGQTGVVQQTGPIEEA